MLKKLRISLLKMAVSIMSKEGIVGANTINSTYDKISELEN